MRKTGPDTVHHCESGCDMNTIRKGEAKQDASHKENTRLDATSDQKTRHNLTDDGSGGAEQNAAYREDGKNDITQ